MKCKTLREYPLSQTIMDYYEYYKANPHEVRRCDGTKATYGFCCYIMHLDDRLFHDGEDPTFVYSYKYVKALIRQAAKQIEMIERR